MTISIEKQSHSSFLHCGKCNARKQSHTEQPWRSVQKLSQIPWPNGISYPKVLLRLDKIFVYEDSRGLSSGVRDSAHNPSMNFHIALTKNNISPNCNLNLFMALQSPSE